MAISPAVIYQPVVGSVRQAGLVLADVEAPLDGDVADEAGSDVIEMDTETLVTVVVARETEVVVENEVDGKLSETLEFAELQNC
jgi:hypothetical protein